MSEQPDLSSWYEDGLQRAWDATSLAPLLACERRYAWQIAEGRGVRGRALEWGIALHAGCEAQEHALAGGAPREEALRYAIREAWEHSAWSTPDHPDKPWRTREALARALVWREEQWGRADPVSIAVVNGVPAIEQRFMLPGGTYPDGRAWFLAGRFDGLVRFGGRLYVRDIKSTTSGLTEWYWRRYAPGVQMALYDYAASSLFGPAHDGVMVEACQIGAQFARWERRFIPTNEALRNDLLTQVVGAVGRAYWTHYYREPAPPNFTACNFCDFRPVCESPASVRAGLLQASFPRAQRWAPTGS